MRGMKDFGDKKQVHFQGSLQTILKEVAEFVSSPCVVNVQPFQIYMLSVGTWVTDIYYEEV